MSNTTITVRVDGTGTIRGLDTVNKGLDGVSQKAKSTKASVDKAVKFDFTASIPGLKSLESAVGGVSKAFGALRAVAVGGVVGATVIRGIGATVDAAVELENALIGVSSISRSFGHDVDEVKKAVLNFSKDGLVSATESALAFKQILSTGTDLPTAIKLMDGLKNAAAFNRQAFYTLGEAVVATTEGIKNGNSIRADAVGITKNLSILDNEYAAINGKVAKNLTDREKVEARVSGFIRESIPYAGDAAKALETYSGSVSGLTTSFTRLLGTLGTFITQNSLIKATISVLGLGFDALSKALTKDSPEEKLAKLTLRLKEVNASIKYESGVYVKYAKDNAKAIEKQIEAIKDSIFYAKLSATETQKSTLKTIAIREKDAAQNLKMQADKKKATEALKKLDTKIQFGGKNEAEKLEDFYKKSLDLIGNDTARKIKLDAYYFSEKKKLQDKDFTHQNEIASKALVVQKQLQDAVSDGSKNLFGKNKTPVTVIAAGQEKEFQKRATVGRGVGIANTIVGGKEGATNLVTGLASAGLDSFMPGLGAAAKPLLDAFAQGPDAVKGMVKEFTKSLPDIVQGFIEAIPVFVQTLADELPNMITKLAEKAPEIVEGFVKAMPKAGLALSLAMPKVALSFAQELVKNLPRIVGEMARAIYDAVSRVLSQLNPFGGGDNSFFSGSSDNGFLGTGIHFAKGGTYKGGAPFTDGMNSRIMNGETVVDYSLTNKLRKSLDEGGIGGNSEIMGLLGRVVSLLETPLEMSSDLKLGSDAFAKAMFKASRTGKRIS